jgi:uncharacterized protein (TIGR02646 family)
MRPVERGPVPISANGQPKKVTDYKDWRADLIDRLGNYCCYCNMPLYDSPQVEHVAPKSLVTSRKLDWDNMLLACGACNSIKNDNPCSPASHFIPDTHNTHLAFAYVTRPHQKLANNTAGIVISHANLTAVQLPKAQNTIALCGLDRVEQTPMQQRRASDLRWRYRFEAMVLASRYRSEWDTLPAAYTSLFTNCLRDIVHYVGFFSIWFAAFHNVPPIKQMLIQAFPGTASCFPTPNFDPVARILGDL